MEESPKSSTQVVSPKVYGYARVSSVDQNEDRQLIALKQSGVEGNNIFIDHKSGKDFNRPAWQRLMRKIRRGDHLIVTSLDRLGRNYEEIQEVWKKLTKKQKVTITILDMPLLNSSAEQGLTTEFLGNLVLQVLAYVAQMEREHIHARQKEGIIAAHLRGVKFGRPRINLPENFQELVKKVEHREISIREASLQCGFSTATFQRYRNGVTSFYK